GGGVRGADADLCPGRAIGEPFGRPRGRGDHEHWRGLDQRRGIGRAGAGAHHGGGGVLSHVVVPARDADGLSLLRVAGAGHGVRDDDVELVRVERHRRGGGVLEGKRGGATVSGDHNGGGRHHGPLHRDGGGGGHGR